MKYKVNKNMNSLFNRFRASASPVTLLFAIIAVFLAFVAYTCSNELRERDMVIKEYEDGSIIMVIDGEVKTACLSGGLCND